MKWNIPVVALSVCLLHNNVKSACAEAIGPYIGVLQRITVIHGKHIQLTSLNKSDTRCKISWEERKSRKRRIDECNRLLQSNLDFERSLHESECSILSKKRVHKVICKLAHYNYVGSGINSLFPCTERTGYLMLLWLYTHTHNSI